MRFSTKFKICRIKKYDIYRNLSAQQFWRDNFSIFILIVILPKFHTDIRIQKPTKQIYTYSFCDKLRHLFLSNFAAEPLYVPYYICNNATAQAPRRKRYRYRYSHALTSLTIIVSTGAEFSPAVRFMRSSLYRIIMCGWRSKKSQSVACHFSA